MYFQPLYFDKKDKFKSMRRKIAIPMENEVLSAHFGHCQKFAIIEVENNQIISSEELNPPEHIPGLYPKWVAQHGVHDVIAGGMGQKAIDLFNQQNINVFIGAPMKSAEELVLDFVNDRLELSANYCNHDDHDHGSCGH